MKPSVHIWSLCITKVLAMNILLLVCATGCDVKDEPAKDIYKARPEHKMPAAPDKKPQPVREIPKIDSLKMPIDTLDKNLKDTTETMDDHEKKPEIKAPRKKYYYLTIHRKPLIT